MCHALTCGSIKIAYKSLSFLFSFLSVTGALPPYPHELFEKSSTKNFCSPSACLHFLFFDSFDCLSKSLLAGFFTQNLHYAAQVRGVGSSGDCQTDNLADIADMTFKLIWVFLVILWFAGKSERFAHLANLVEPNFAVICRTVNAFVLVEDCKGVFFGDVFRIFGCRSKQLFVEESNIILDFAPNSKVFSWFCSAAADCKDYLCFLLVSGEQAVQLLVKIFCPGGYFVVNLVSAHNGDGVLADIL